MKPRARNVGYGLMGLLLAALLVLLWALFSETGSRWLLRQIPGFGVENFSGRLGADWQADALLWRSGETALRIEAPQMSLDAGCLWRLTLCIERLASGDIRLDLPEPSGTDGKPPELPNLRLPVGVELAELSVGRLYVDGSERFQALSARASWHGDGVVLETLNIRAASAVASLSGRLRPQDDWPLNVNAELELLLEPGKPLQLALQATGELAGLVSLEATARGYGEGRLSGEIRPLAQSLPASASLSIERLALKRGEAALSLGDTRIDVTGDLSQGYGVFAEGRLNGQGGTLALELAGRLFARRAELDHLRLRAGEGRFAELAGRLDWSEALGGEARLALAEFPWQWLYPLDGLPVALRGLSARAEFEQGRYRGQFAAALEGPAGPFSLASPLEGDLQRLRLTELDLRAGPGRAAGSLELAFAEGFAWLADLRLNHLDPAYWVEALPGDLSGTLRSRGRVAPQLAVDAQLALTGQLREQPAGVELQLTGADGHWQVPVLLASLGRNRVQGQGRWDGEVVGELDLALLALQQLWPGLSGAAQGRLAVSGSTQAADASLTLSGRGLSFDNRRIERLSLSARVEQSERGALELTARGLRSAGTALGDLQLSGEGTLAEHRARLALDNGPLSAGLLLSGGLLGEHWRARLADGRVEGFGQRWSMAGPADVERLPDGRLRLGTHCWSSPPARLCAGEMPLLPEPRIDLQLDDFPTERLAGLLPDDFAWVSTLAGRVELNFVEGGPSGSVHLEAAPGSLRLREGERWLDYPYRQLTSTLSLTPREAGLQLAFAGDSLGGLTLQARIDPRGAGKPLSGQFNLEGLDIGIARPFLPGVGQLQGVLGGSGRLAGSLAEPTLSGLLQLDGGRVAGPGLPTEVEDLSLRLAIEGRQVQVDGAWRSGEQGRGRLRGTLGYQQGPLVDLRLTGQQLPLVVEPYAELEVAPDLRIHLADDALAIEGRVAVPRGDIHIRELPPDTVQLSPDAVIVGEEQKAPTPLNVAMDVTVLVGEERLRFSGFGLTADVKGEVHVGDNLDTRGELRLENGRYRAYGQRLSVRRARLFFAGPADQPYLDVEAIRRIERENVIAGLRISGNAANPTIEVFSEPAMSEEQALSYLVLGRAPGGNGGDSNLLAEAALGLGLSRAQGIAGQLAQGLGIEQFQLETEGSGATTEVVASGQLTDRLSLRYGIGVFEPVNTFTLRYQLTRRIFLEAASGLASSLDLFYRHDF